MDDPTEREEMKEPPALPPADGDASPGDGGAEGGTWEDEAEDTDVILTPEGEDEEPSSEEAPKVCTFDILSVGSTITIGMPCIW